jgi:tetratricopeptide (TPR) repeat protein
MLGTPLLACMFKGARLFLSLNVVLLQFYAAAHALEPAMGEYVGRGACAACHAQQLKLWEESHHDLAMQPANDASVLADFSGTEFTQTNVITTFYTKGTQFMVRTDGPDGKSRDYEVKYTFGVSPLQQYLVELDKGRLQALSIAWDTRPESEGGQRWFHLYPGERIDHTDELHWTGPNFNWNGMCAECHSTGLQKNYDSASDTFNTEWSEIDVSCEACHGPASRHLAWAGKKTGWEAFSGDKGLSVSFDERSNVHWKIDDKTGNARRSVERTSEKEIQVCAQCHSRRSAISYDYSPGKPFLEHYMPRLLDEGMYFADGQIQDEVYVYGSFLQSKMYHAGVTCSDCHEPHSMQLRQPGKGVCLQCHAADKFDSKTHHFHVRDSSGAQCAECHMPPRNYMVVDPRHDHSFRIPRPDLSVELGTPNACNGCHDSRDAAWAAAQVRQWYGKDADGYQQFAQALYAGREGNVDAASLLVQVIRDAGTPDIARASAVGLLSNYLDQTAFDVIRQGRTDSDAMVRMASVGALEGLPPALLMQTVLPLLDDPVKSVRIEAARVLAGIPDGQLQHDQLASYESAAEEYIESQMVNADRPMAQFNLGNYYRAGRELDLAESSYKQALLLQPGFVAAHLNLADLYRSQGKEHEALKLLLEAVEHAPDSADVHHALGLLYIRQQLPDKATAELKVAASLAPDNARYTYVYAVAMHSSGKRAQAIEQLQAAHKRFPGDLDILNALVAYHREAGNSFAAESYMRKLNKINRLRQ